MSDLARVIGELQRGLAEAHKRIAELEGRHERMHRPGKVTDVDTKKQRYRQEIGVDPDGQPVKSPWVPYAQKAGAYKQHLPPSVGQQFILKSPDGDFSQAYGEPLTWSDDHPSPGDGADPVTTYGKHKITMATDAHTHALGSAEIAFKANGGIRHVAISREKFVLKLGGTFYAIKEDALETTSDI